MATKKKAVAQPTQVAILLMDFGSYKKGDKVPVIGKDILVDGKTYKISELCDDCVKITTSDALFPVYDEHFMEKVVRHSVEDAQNGRYKVGENGIFFNLETLSFNTAVIEGGDALEFPAYIRTGLALPADTTVTKAVRRLANLNKAYNLGLDDFDIADIVGAFDGFYVKPEEVTPACPTSVLADVLERIAKKL